MENKNLILWGVGLVLAFILFSQILVYGLNGSRGGMMNMMYGYGGFFPMITLWSFFVLVIIALVLFIAWLIKQLSDEKYYKIKRR